MSAVDQHVHLAKKDRPHGPTLPLWRLTSCSNASTAEAGQADLTEEAMGCTTTSVSSIVLAPFHMHVKVCVLGSVPAVLSYC